MHINLSILILYCDVFILVSLHFYLYTQEAPNTLPVTSNGLSMNLMHETPLDKTILLYW